MNHHININYVTNTYSYFIVGTVAAIVAASYSIFKKNKNKIVADNVNNEKNKTQHKMNQNEIQSEIEMEKKDEMNKNKNDKIKKKYPFGKVYICFGSQTGTAEGFAQNLVTEGCENGFDCTLMDLEDYNYKEELTLDNHKIINENKIYKKIIIFLMATYGEGEPTDNAMEFIKFLKNKDSYLNKNSFSTIYYTVFGLGNKQYEQYNAIGKLVFKKMNHFGAKICYNYGEGDDDKCLEDDFNLWKDNLWITLKKELFQNESNVQEINDKKDKISTMKPSFNFKCILISKKQLNERSFKDNEIQHSTRHFFNYSLLKVIDFKELRYNIKNGSTIQIDLGTKDYRVMDNNINIQYETADDLAIIPENNPNHVQEIAEMMNYNLNDIISLDSINQTNMDTIRYPFPFPCSVNDILKKYLDLNSSPRKSLLTYFAHYTNNLNDKKKLLFLVSKEGKDEYNNIIINKKKNIIDVLKMFNNNNNKTNIQIPLEDFIQIIPYIQPRYYTISSSHTMNPKRIQLTISLVKHYDLSDPLHPIHFEGLCTSYLNTKKPLLPLTCKEKEEIDKINNGSNKYGEQGKKKIRQWPMIMGLIRKSNFRLPYIINKPDTFMIPIIMVGPGTGIAPMRAFLQERQYYIDNILKKSNDIILGKSILYFGCRNKYDNDFIYENELNHYIKTGALTQLYTAFSRDNENKKVYVQDLMKVHATELYELIINQNAYMYVCGGTKMGSDVHKTLEDILSDSIHLLNHKNNDKTEDEHRIEVINILKKLHQEGRYIQELWA